jgi:hypothetical protein
MLMHATHKKYLFYGATHKGQSDARLLTNVEAVNFFRSLELRASGLTPTGTKPAMTTGSSFLFQDFLPSNNTGSHGNMKLHELI